MITKNKVVYLSYELRINPDEACLERADEKSPLEFICGHGQTLEYFEMNLLGLKEGDLFNFRIPTENAYGKVNEEMILDLPRDIFSEVDPQELTIGHSLAMRDSMGRHLQGLIVSLNEEEVRMNFNHPLAGKDLYFSGKVLTVRDASDEELERLHSSKCGGCSGCGDDGCGSGCGDDYDDEGDCGCGCGH